MARTSGFVACLLGVCVSRLAVAGERGPALPAGPQRVEQAVARSITYLQAESAAWLKTRKCAACHHVPMPLWALSEARRQGYAIDDDYLANTFESLPGSEVAIFF